MIDLSKFLPFDRDANVPTPQKTDASAQGAGGFSYIGQAYDLLGFADYVATYNFGSVPPDYIVLHHTANPDASWAPLNTNPNIKWDRNEAGMSAEQIKAKRKPQLDAIMAYYRDSLHWTKGPHLFVDERWIWLFTPMYEVGIHAAQGNSYNDSSGNLHYSLGIEVIGYYEHVAWPAQVAYNTSMAIALIKQRLGTYDYIDGPWAGKIGAHRMYNKPECPGARIVPSYYMPVLQSAWGDLTAQPVLPQYMVMGTPVYQREDCTGSLWGHLNPGEVIELDATYDGGKRGHLRDGRGFVWIDDSLRRL